MKLKKFVHYGASLMLALVLLGVFAPNVVLSQSTNGGGTAAPASVEPKPGTFVPSRLPVTRAQAYEYATGAVHGYWITISADDGNSASALIERSTNLSFEQEMRLVTQQFVIENKFDTNVGHRVLVTAETWNLCTMFAAKPFVYRHDGKGVAAEHVGDGLEIRLQRDVHNVLEMPFPAIKAAKITYRDATGKTVVWEAVPRFNGTESFFVEQSVYTGILGVPVGLDSLYGTLEVESTTREIHEYSLPSGQLTASTIKRSVSIAPDTVLPNRIVVTIAGKVGEYFELRYGNSLDSITNTFARTNSQKVVQTRFFVGPNGSTSFKIPVAGDELQLFTAEYFDSAD